MFRIKVAKDVVIGDETIGIVETHINMDDTEPNINSVWCCCNCDEVFKSLKKLQKHYKKIDHIIEPKKSKKGKKNKG